MRYQNCAATAALIVILCGCAATQPNTDYEDDVLLAQRAGAPLFEGMGTYTKPITTQSQGAQRYFDQGMVLAFGFNHAESIRSFRAAQKLDPACAMCFWGEALATGPNINVTADGKALMLPDAQVAAYAAIQQASALKSTATPKEQALIEALAQRYASKPVDDRADYDIAFAREMGELNARYPADDDIAAIYAEAWMNTMPWDYWSDGDTPRPETVPVINALETILARNPEHPLALHLYIHAVEASSRPERAEQAADTLAALVPGSGHLVHMPSHIYWRIGRYHDASVANINAAAVDERYIAQCNAQGFYPALYYPHNIHFLWAASSMEGRSAVAIEAARKVAANIRLEQIEQFPSVEFFHTIPLLALVQFGRWDDVLEEPAPNEALHFSRAIWHYSRAIASANSGDSLGAKREHDALRALKNSDKIEFLVRMAYPATTLLDIADHLIAGEISLVSGDYDDAIVHFSEAVSLQDTLPYMEPPFWYYSTRQSLGVALLKAEQFDEAERVYRDDLAHFPRNGWAMFGLAQALDGLGRTTDAAQVRLLFRKAWAMADVELMSSRM